MLKRNMLSCGADDKIISDAPTNEQVDGGAISKVSQGVGGVNSCTYACNPGGSCFT